MRYRAIIILDDSHVRIGWFERHFPDAEIFRNSKALIPRLNTLSKVDILFLDYALGSPKMGAQHFDSGMNVVIELRKTRRHIGQVVCHSTNPEKAE
ncbi:MAG: cyclic-phosphate processing receiver domain-containing protein [Tepidisphaeraceae bacterium]